MNTTSEHKTGHELTDTPITPIVLTGAFLAAGAALVMLIVYGTFHFFATHPLSTPVSPMAQTETQVPPEPRLAEHPAVEIQQLHEQEDKTLTTYGWQDKANGVVRIPIDRAIDLELERGYPVRKDAAKMNAAQGEHQAGAKQ